MNNHFVHPRLRTLFASMDLLARAAEVGYQRAQKRRRMPGPYGYARKPGYDTPFWNILRKELRQALKAYGAKANMARFLGIPRQRVTEYLSSQKRLPDAELTLRLLHWLTALEQGRNHLA